MHIRRGVKKIRAAIKLDIADPSSMRCIYIHIHTCMLIYICIHTYTHICLYTYVYIHPCREMQFQVEGGESSISKIVGRGGFNIKHME